MRLIQTWTSQSSRSRLASSLALLAIGLGLYATLQDAADLILGLASALAITTAHGKRRIQDPVTFLLFVPVAISSLWSVDPGDSARIAARLLGILLACPLPKNDWSPVKWFPMLLLAMSLAAALSWSEPRPNLLADNAFAAAELGLIGILTGSPILAALAMPILAATKTRSVLGILWVYAALSGRWRLLAIALATTCLWLWSASCAGNVDRLSIPQVEQGISMRADNAGIINTGYSAAAARAEGWEPPDEPVYVSPVLGTGAGGYLEAYGVQRPHSVPLLLWHELGIFSTLVFAGLGMVLWRVGLARSAALVLLWTVWSDSAAGDAAGMYTAALLAAHSQLLRNSAFIPKRGGQFYFLRFGTRLALVPARRLSRFALRQERRTVK